MRHKGRLTQWRDERGFGFVTPLDGGERAFVHISAFSSRGRRPLANDLITYELVRDGQGRRQACKVAFAAGRRRQPFRPGRVGAALWIGGGFLAGLAVVAAAGLVPLIVPLGYATASLVAFCAYAMDKAAARRARWRTPEATLHLLGLLGGWPGGLLAQRALRHKSRKPSFQAVFWLTVVVNCSALSWWLITGEEPWR